MYKREETINRMNALGGAGEPFFFVISHDLQHNLLVPAHETVLRPVALVMPSGSLGAAVDWSSRPERPHDLFFEPCPPSRERYERAFLNVREHLVRGDSYLLNLCMATPVKTNVTLEHVFHEAQAPYRMLLGADPGVPGVHGRACVCFSPEPFVTMRGRTIATFPMKGTAPADTEEARRRLESDEKESRESATIVDLMRNDLSMVASGVHVSRYRYMSAVTTRNGPMLQCSSEIRGELPPDWRACVGDILMALLPAGSVTGAPKQATCKAIAESEEMERGYYTGVFGLFNGRELESAVAIRFMEQGADGLVYKSGGGITVMSDLDDEYRELKNKVYVPFAF